MAHAVGLEPTFPAPITDNALEPRLGYACVGLIGNLDDSASHAVRNTPIAVVAVSEAMKPRMTPWHI